jgi:hypothetical protein
VNLNELLKSIPDKKLSFLGVETKVDHQVKKLKGTIIFRLILMSMLESSKASLRVMEAVTQSAKFKKLIGSQEISTKYNSIRDRICNINYEFFEQIFIYLFNKYNLELEELNAPTKVDSTYVSLPAKLISWGMFNGKTSKKNPGVRQLKYSMSLKGSLPSSVEIFTEQSFISEDKALSEAITNNIHSDNSIMIVDRGLTSRDAFVKLVKPI